MKQTQRPQRDLTIRWMICRDMDQVLAIEREAFPDPWMKKDFETVLRKLNCIGVVAADEDERRIIGYMLYHLKPRRLELLNLAVRNTHRRLGIGTAMTDKLKRKLSLKRRVSIVADVIDTNDRAIAFFRSQEFEARVVADYYELPDTGERRDAYRFEYSKR